jgi:SAM-dependent methyltransferase
LQQTVGANSIPDNSLDLAMSLGVLHHIPDTALAISDIAQKIKPGHYFLCYLYYKLDNKPFFYRTIFKIVDEFRIRIARLSPKNRRVVTLIIAASIYLPLARLSKLLNYMKLDVSNIPLHHYAQMPFVMLANDALDRFGTSLEQRFSKSEIYEMLSAADFDLDTLVFSDLEPFWCFAVKKNI